MGLRPEYFISQTTAFKYFYNKFYTGKDYGRAYGGEVPPEEALQGRNTVRTRILNKHVNMYTSKRYRLHIFSPIK